MIHLDTSVLVDALTGPRRSGPALLKMYERGERVQLSTMVLYEWLRGPRREAEIADQEALFPLDQAQPFGPREAALAAELYRTVSRARDRELDLAVAACAVTRGAIVWTLNDGDLRDIPGLALFQP